MSSRLLVLVGLLAGLLLPVETSGQTVKKCVGFFARGFFEGAVWVHNDGDVETLVRVRWLDHSGNTFVVTPLFSLSPGETGIVPASFFGLEPQSQGPAVVAKITSSEPHILVDAETSLFNDDPVLRTDDLATRRQVACQASVATPDSLVGRAERVPPPPITFTVPGGQRGRPTQK